MRVTGDCFFAAAFLAGFADFFTALFFFAADLDALFETLFDALFALLFALLVPRDAARFEAVDDLRRAVPPDDFDADAMMNSSWEGTAQHCARFAHSVEPDDTQNAKSERDPRDTLWSGSLGWRTSASRELDHFAAVM